MAPHGKELPEDLKKRIVALHKDGVGYTKIAGLMDYWNHVLWSDATKINFFGSDGVKRVWRQPGEEYKDKCVLPTVMHGGGSVMVWGYISAAGTGELQFIEGTMIANMYCDIIKQSMIPETGPQGSIPTW